MADRFDNQIPLESNGGIPVNLQDQTTPPVDLYFIQAIGAPTTIASAVSIDDTVINVVSAAAISVGNYMGIFHPAEQRFLFTEVLAVNTLAITIDSPADFDFEVGDNVISTTRDLATAGGTLASPDVFIVSGAGTSSELEIDITRIIFSMVLSGAPDDGLFGNITRITNGLVLRLVNGVTRNIFNFKDNSDFANIAYDVSYAARTVPQGSYGMRCRLTFAGQDKHGVTLRLSGNDELQLLMQDNISGLTSFRAIAMGHIVTD